MIGAAWLLPLALAPALFSRDVYSYLAQGTILHLGHNPYQSRPGGPGRARAPAALAAVSPFWRHTTAPYGPLFLGRERVVSITGSHLVAGVLVTRAGPDRGGAAGGIRAAHRAGSGASPSRAHLAGRAQPAARLRADRARSQRRADGRPAGRRRGRALRGRPVLGVAICALAATVKLPALAGAVFIIVAWARAEPHLGPGPVPLEAVAAGRGMLAAVSVVTGLGFSWFSASLFSTPAKVHLAITPATALGWTVAELLRAVGIVGPPHGGPRSAR